MKKRVWFAALSRSSLVRCLSSNQPSKTTKIIWVLQVDFCLLDRIWRLEGWRPLPVRTTPDSEEEEEVQLILLELVKNIEIQQTPRVQLLLLARMITHSHCQVEGSQGPWKRALKIKISSRWWPFDHFNLKVHHYNSSRSHKGETRWPWWYRLG